jgi:hypothetical protein
MSEIIADPTIDILIENDRLNPSECITLDKFRINPAISKLLTAIQREHK